MTCNCGKDRPGTLDKFGAPLFLDVCEFDGRIQNCEVDQLIVP
jgi:hypothetical protein